MKRYFIELEENGKPKIGSKVHTSKRSKRSGRLAEITHLLKPCCNEDEPVNYEAIHYYIVVNNGVPISGTVTKQKPTKSNFVDITSAYIENSCCYNVLKLKNFDNGNTPSYPVGVFNVNGVYLGVADDQEEYITIWNSDLDNNEQGTLEAFGDQFTFKIDEKATITSVIGLRFWTITLDSASGFLYLSDDTHVELANGTVVKSEVSPVGIPSSEFWMTTVQTMPGVNQVTICPDTFRKVPVTIGNLRIFHNEKGSYASMSVGHLWRNNGGYLPPNVKVISFYRITQNLDTFNFKPENYVNYTTATKDVELFQVNGSHFNWSEDYISHMSKLKAFQFVMNGADNSNRFFRRYGLNETNHPALKQIIIRYNNQPSLGDFIISDMSVLASVSWGIDFNGSRINTSVDLDNCIIGLSQSIGPAAVPGGTVCGVQLFVNVLRTSASDAAVAQIQSLGYTTIV